ncbi:hypothetical protein SAMN05216490_1271 [Mucilaginibacter mallensis]|uniref:Collagen triple helix repeat-containing protein n=1 Tax=Mucilaginibacter mallensis TaxID=652787 RepID=A0A1H1SQZ3_MUCMA|nr:collagen-like protein [Mucilaginibacter mallensis]SDS50341.1 hypothetical protein SAMN05216490_1271 [Mucilaginibacter mallensis]
MKKINYLLLLAAAMLFAASCGKDGAVGPQGSTGAKGAQGVVGPAGPAGANGQNGSVIYSGSTVPLTTTGANGDFYLNTSTGLLYGPKTTSGWGTGFSLVGATGATGATGAAGTPGSKTLSGVGAPATSLGSLGDYYLDDASYLLYGPKVSSGWGTPVSLQGPPGTANVMYTDWFTPPTYKKDTVFGVYGFSAKEAIPAITQSILDNGTVITYGKLNGYVSSIWPTNQVSELPISITYMDGSAANIDTWSAFATPGTLEIRLVSSLNAYGGISNAHQFRCIVIPGGVNIPATIGYAALQRYLRIKDN